MTITGVLGGRWRATVTPWGAIEPWDGSVAYDWHIAADDRWHSPQHEAAVRQTVVVGTPVVETRVRIPDGDAVQRVYSVADDGGLTIIEIQNDSPLPIAVAFTRSDLRSARPSSSSPPKGIELPAGSVVFPIGHRSTLTVAISHAGTGGLLPTVLPAALQVARGWVAMSDRASRFVLPDPAMVDSLVAMRCDLALNGPAHPDDDPVGFLIGVGQLVRMGERPHEWVPDIAHAVEVAAKGDHDWALGDALIAAEQVFGAAGESRARRDLAAVLRRIGLLSSDRPGAVPSGARLAPWLEQRMVATDGTVLPGGIPTEWLGANFEAYGLPVGAASRVSLAVRWHGDRPAVLWEVEGDAVRLAAPVVAPQWSTQEPRGEALWPAPESISFG